MNRKNLTAAVLAGLAGAAGIVGSAQAVNINPDGLGQVLIYPYYTTNGGNLTIVSVVNTTDQAKAVKVRFLEGMNSREVLDFNLYLSAYDVWVAAVTGGSTPTLEVNDTTCTVPYIYGYANNSPDPGGKQDFLTYALTDGGPSDTARTAEGHFEMIEMGTLVNATGGPGSATAATHGSNGVPVDSTNSVTLATGPCEQLIGAWTFAPNPANDGYWTSNPLMDITAPSGGLFGGAGIINVAKASLYAYDAVAINNWTQSTTSDGSGDIIAAIHSSPGNIEPSLGSGDQRFGTILLSTPVAPAIALYSPVFTRGVDAVSYTLMRDTVMNEYATEVSLDGKTEWVITFPTKNDYVDADNAVGTPRAPFTVAWDTTLATACEPVSLEIWDREERVEEGTSTGPVVSPERPDEPGLVTELCYETNVVQFNAADGDTPSTLLGSSRVVNIDNINDLGFESGWMRMSFGTADPANNLGGLLGLPVTGFRLQEFTYNQAGIIATYGGLWQHKYTRMCSTGNNLGIEYGCNYPSGG